MRGDLASRIAGLGDGLHRLRLGDGRAAVVKRRRGAPAGFFAMEAHGLALLRDAGGLRVAEVIAVGDGAIVLEDLGTGRPSTAHWRAAGRALVRQHARVSDRFGLDRDGWCGDGAQANTPMLDGWRFFAECRLLPQGRRAFDAGLLGAADVAALERLCARCANAFRDSRPRCCTATCGSPTCTPAPTAAWR
nr:fructosamine kinase family protein [Pseudoxanthomonas suwonensis]